MKLMNKDEWIEKLNDLIKEVNSDSNPEYSILKVESSLNDKKETSGSLSVVISIENTAEKAIKKDTKIAMYIFENHNAITTFIINGRNLSLLFENSTMNSPDISLHYLKDILFSEMEWFVKLEKELQDKKAESMRKKFDSRKKTNGNRNSVYHKNNSERSGKRYNGDYKKKYNNNRPYGQKQFSRKPYLGEGRSPITENTKKY